jgi:glutamate dehydrogenase
VFPVRAQEDTGADPAAIARAYTIAREVFAARDIWTEIEALDNRIPAAVQYTAMYQTTRLLRHASYWLLENLRGNLDIERAVRRYAGPVGELSRELNAVLSPTARGRLGAQRAQLVAERVPEHLATRVASLDTMHCALDLVEASTAARVPVGFAAKVYFELGERLGLTWIKEQIEGLAVDGQWQAAARRTVRDDLYALQRKITAAVLKCKGREAAQRVDRWSAGHGVPVDALKRIVVDLRTGAPPDFATLSVALQAVRRLAQE